MRKVTLAFAMLPLLASAPVLAAGSAGMGANARGVNAGGLVRLAQAGDPGSQQACELARQNAQSYARILQLRDRMVAIQRENEARFRALEKGKGGAGGGIAIGSTAVLDEAMRDTSAAHAGQNGMYAGQGAAVQMELLRNLTGRIEDVDAQIADTGNQLQKTQEDNEFRFQELEKSRGIAAPPGGAGQSGQASAAGGGDLCSQGITGVSEIAGILGSRAEAMTFQILEMQDQMQKMQEDNERRFQALEGGGRADAGEGGGTSLADAAPAASGQDNAPGAPPGASGTQQAAGDASGADSVAIGSSAPDQGGPARGEPPQVLGSIRFDANGNVIGETVSATPRPVQQGNGAQGSVQGSAVAGGDIVASLPTDDNPNALYQSSYQYLMAGDYKAAETGFRQHVKRYPADPMTAEARFWLGESLYGQARYPEAATVFIDTQRDYPDSKRGAENMFKLGMTLEKMDNHDVACATFEQIPQRYPKAAPAILKRVADERARVNC